MRKFWSTADEAFPNGTRRGVCVEGRVQQHGFEVVLLEIHWHGTNVAGKRPRASNR